MSSRSRAICSRLRLDVLDRPRVPLVALAVVRAVVATERRQPPVAELPDAGHGRVEERPVVRRDQERAGAPPEVLLEPLEGVEVEVVRGLVEHQQVRVGDDQASQRGPRLLAAGQGGRWLGPLVAGEAEPGQRRVDALVQGVAAQDLESVLEVGVRGIGHPAVALERRQLLGHAVQVCRAGADRQSERLRGHERLVEVRLLGEQTRRSGRACGGPRRYPVRRDPRRSAAASSCPRRSGRPGRSGRRARWRHRCRRG